MELCLASSVNHANVLEVVSYVRINRNMDSNISDCEEGSLKAKVSGSPNNVNGMGDEGMTALLADCDAVEFSNRMLEMEMSQPLFQLIRIHFERRDVLLSGLNIIELLVVDSRDWRDEVARSGGVELLCDVLTDYKDDPQVSFVVYFYFFQ